MNISLQKFRGFSSTPIELDLYTITKKKEKLKLGTIRLPYLEGMQKFLQGEDILLNEEPSHREVDSLQFLDNTFELIKKK